GRRQSVLPGPRGALNAAQRRLPEEDSQRLSAFEGGKMSVVTIARPEAPPGRLLARPQWVEGNPSLREITDDVVRPLEARPGKAWWICFGVAFAALLNLVAMVAYLVSKGIGVWGLNNSVGWAFDITNFVFWLRIVPAGPLIP